MKFVLTALKYLVLMNLVLFLGDVLFDIDLEFNLITNVTMPLICAVTEWEAKRKTQAANR